MANRDFQTDDFDKFAVDEKGRLIWNGEAVVVERRLKLERYQILLATAATLGTVASAVHPFGTTLGWW